MLLTSSPDERTTSCKQHSKKITHPFRNAPAQWICKGFRPATQLIDGRHEFSIVSTQEFAVLFIPRSSLSLDGRR